MGFGSLLRGVVYHGDPSIRRALLVIVERAGVEVVESEGMVTDVVEHVRPLRPDLIVLELALAATRGVDIVPELLAAVPGAAVVLLCPFVSLREPAIRAGAYDLVNDDDLRDLQGSVRRLVAERMANGARA